MCSITILLKENNLFGSPPDYVTNNLMYETVMGSQAYGVSNNKSDIDLYGFCIPDKKILFPHITGYIDGFGDKPVRFDQYQLQHILYNNTMYDITIYNIVKYFQLCMDNNPNMIDSMFTHTYCINYITNIGKMVIDNRHMFLHKGCYHKFMGYAFSQLNKAKSTTRVGKRKDSVDTFGFDPKFLYHVVRLILECETILKDGDLDLTKHKDFLLSVKHGNCSIDFVDSLFKQKEIELRELYEKCSLPYSPDKNKIKELLIRCLEEHFGSIDHLIKE